MYIGCLQASSKIIKVNLFRYSKFSKFILFIEMQTSRVYRHLHKMASACKNYFFIFNEFTIFLTGCLRRLDKIIPRFYLDLRGTQIYFLNLNFIFYVYTVEAAYCNHG